MNHSSLETMMDNASNCNKPRPSIRQQSYNSGQREVEPLQ
jgi:hypothetical protein